MKNRFVKFGSIVLLSLAAVAAVGQTAPKSPRPNPVPKISVVVGNGSFPKSENAVGLPIEKAVATTEKPSISFCVGEGKVNVRGWERGEVRAMADGGKLSFKVMQRGADNKASKLFVHGFDEQDAGAKRDECLNGADIEIEVPYGASVGIKTRDAEVSIEAVARATVKSIGGSVYLREITEEADVSTLAGEISAEDSAGRIVLKSIGGEISAHRLRPSKDDDGFTANSAGSVTLQDISHSSVEANSTSGELIVVGALVSGGSYEFTTTTGEVTLVLPAASSFRLTAALSQGGHFQTDFPLKYSNQTTGGQAKLINGVYGTGDASINMTSFSGVLQIKRK